MSYLWDTNTVIYFLQQQFPTNSELYIDGLLKDGLPIISAITEIELLCWQTPLEKELEVVKAFINDSRVIELEPTVKSNTVKVRKAHKIKLPDAIIAATAITHGLTLLTRNVRDFQHINGLKLINPWEIK